MTLTPEALAASRSSCTKALVLSSLVTWPQVAAEYAEPEYNLRANGDIRAIRLIAATLLRVLVILLPAPTRLMGFPAELMTPKSRA